MILPSQGVYDKENPYLVSMNASLDPFQCEALASAEIATPTSPIAPDLASGEIFIKGTAVVIILCVESCPIMVGWALIFVRQEIRNIVKTSLLIRISLRRLV